ncbi:hypothetical protein NX059_003755 [Plenodomus lindquistii]|nr:hypothetical protein NX059_003755 [Plenodomus lindquistii]
MDRSSGGEQSLSAGDADRVKIAMSNYHSVSAHGQLENAVAKFSWQSEEWELYRIAFGAANVSHDQQYCNDNVRFYEVIRGDLEADLAILELFDGIGAI